MSDSAAADVIALHQALDEAPLSRLHWKIWFLSAMGIFLDGFDLFIIGVALPLISASMDADPWTVGLIGAAAPLGAMVGAFTLGPLTDRFGRKSMYLVDLFIFLVFTALSALAWGPLSLMTFRFLLGVGIGADYPISSSYIVEFMPARLRGKMLIGGFSFQAAGALAGRWSDWSSSWCIPNSMPGAGCWRPAWYRPWPSWSCEPRCRRARAGTNPTGTCRKPWRWRRR